MLILACNELSQSSGVQIVRYDFSEPQNGKDICDRIICPMKSSISSFCNEGHDILSAVDMHTALKERPGKGVTASVGVIDESKNTLMFKKLTDSASTMIGGLTASERAKRLQLNPCTEIT